MPKYHWDAVNVKQSGYDDMVLLPKVNEQGIFENLKKRFMDNYIYTYIGPVLIALNPYKEMPYFTEKEIELYNGATQIENPPHIYAVADNMYRNMIIDSENQCVIISGESGAGKTISAKYIMNYVSRVSGGGTEKVKKVKDIILQSNPLLESFGNAKTLRNNNSSRFGKYVEIQFSNGGEPIGGKITSFLLEKSRVVSQIKNERNFHIFYQLCSHKDENLHKSLGIQTASRFQYLAKSECFSVDGINDNSDFQDVLRALDVVKISKDDQMSIFSIIASILHIGNIQFSEKGNFACLFDDNSLQYPSYLLKIDKELLKLKLTSRVIETRNERLDTKFNVEQAEFARNALAKAIYSRLFDYLVETINMAMANTAPNLMNLGILDIYGFEVFSKNGFEQFCINYVNEKLQQIFIELTLKAEQEEYKQEGIKWNEISYFNNKIVCELIESNNQPPGIFSLCDDVVKTMHAVGDGADNQLIQSLRKNHSSHAHFSTAGNGFIVKHYAGDVSYDINGFSEKNRDVLFQDLIDLMKSSSNRFVANLFPEQQSTNKIPTTAGKKIKTQANELVKKLMQCFPHYIRCIKPNELKKPLECNEELLKHQIKYLGLVENIKVRRAGFAYRREFEKFIHRYAIVCKKSSKDKLSGPLNKQIQTIMDAANVDPNEWQMGKTKLFIKAPESLFQLEELRERRYNEYALILQRAFKKMYATKYFLKLRQEASDIVINKKERREASLNRKYYSDYIGLDSYPGIKALINKREVVEFAQTCIKYDRQFKKTARDLVLTNRSIYIIGRVMDKKRKHYVEVLKRQIELLYIEKLVLSKNRDNFVLIYPNNDYATVIELEFKTEFLVTLFKRYKEAFKKPLNIQFVDSIDYTIKREGWGGGGNRIIKFSKDASVKDVQLKVDGKVLNVRSKPGLPASTKPSQPKFTFDDFKREPWWSKFDQLKDKFNIKLKSASEQKTFKKAQNPSENVFKPPVATRSARIKTEPNYPKCKAIYDYIASESDELSFKENDIIYIVKEDPSNWWSGILKGRTGLFPANYVQKL